MYLEKLAFILIFYVVEELKVWSELQKDNQTWDDQLLCSRENGVRLEAILFTKSMGRGCGVFPKTYVYTLHFCIRESYCLPIPVSISILVLGIVHVYFSFDILYFCFVLFCFFFVCFLFLFLFLFLFFFCTAHPNGLPRLMALYKCFILPFYISF